MEQPCVRVERERGERTRRRLAELELIDEFREITVEDGSIYIPVTDPSSVPEELDTVEYATPRRNPQTMPDDLVEFDASYERLGDVVIIDEDDPDRGRRLAEAIVESDLNAATVLDRASKISGELRVRDWNVLAGERTETVHREYGCEFLLDPTEVYFSPRLATERRRVTDGIEAGEHVFDMFAGVGPFVIPAAKREATVVGVDKNERAIAYLLENARRNGVEELVTAIHGDVRDVADDYTGWADRIVMNLPHSADEFLDVAMVVAGEVCRLHYYDIQHEDDPFGPGERAIEAAASPEYDLTVENRQRVRSYGPHELNVCLDVVLERR